MAELSLFTFILEYRGGTYTSQIRAKSVQKALLLWAEALPVNEIAQFGPKLKQKLIRGLTNDEFRLYEPVHLVGLENVWFASLPLPGWRTGLNIVQTDPSKPTR